MGQEQGRTDLCAVHPKVGRLDPIGDSVLNSSLSSEVMGWPASAKTRRRRAQTRRWRNFSNGLLVNVKSATKSRISASTLPRLAICLSLALSLPHPLSRSLGLVKIGLTDREIEVI